MDLLLPDIGLFVWNLLGFLILFFILRATAWKPILKSLNEREKGITDSLASAERIKAEMAQMKNENEALLAKARNQAYRRSVVAMGMAGVLRAWSRPQPTSWKKPSCAANAGSWNRRAWPVEATSSKCSRSSVARRRSAGTILAPVGQGRNTRSATVLKLNPF